MQPAVVSFEQDTDAGIIEEEDPKNNVQPAEAGIGLDIDNEEDLDEHLAGLVVVLLMLWSQIARRNLLALLT